MLAFIYSHLISVESTPKVQNGGKDFCAIVFDFFRNTSSPKSNLIVKVLIGGPTTTNPNAHIEYETRKMLSFVNREDEDGTKKSIRLRRAKPKLFALHVVRSR